MKKLNNQKNLQHSFTIKLANGVQERITFTAENIVHIVGYQGSYPKSQPTTMKSQQVNTGGDPTIATGKINKKRALPFVEKTTLIPFTISVKKNYYLLQTAQITLKIDTYSGQISCYERHAEKPLFTQVLPVFKNGQVSTTLKNINPTARYFGGGMQNGHYDHTGKIIKIENTNDWLDRGVTSPAPFIWSNSGFGIVNNTYGQGNYDCQNPQQINFNFQDYKADNYYLIGFKPEKILQAYFKLTGKPLLLPKFAWYPAHLNAYNRDTWIQVTADSSGARLFEDGKYYKEYQPINPKSFNVQRPGKITLNNQQFVPAVQGNGDVTFEKDKSNNLQAVRESLNGEQNNYQFSARQIIDRYQQADMPLGWFLPNDGYGAGYGQTADLKQNIANLAEFSQYAASHGIKTGLWTQENLLPQNLAHPRADERDFPQEVAQAQVAAIKTDVAWVGDGYQAGIGALHDASFYMRKYGHNQRPFAVTVDGWAGTQKYAAVWTGDQAGGTWENIGYQIPTYLSSSLSGLANVGGDIDGIYGGGKPIIQTRDLQWKSFTPLQLNMDGWGSENKTPFTFGQPYTAINRFYLKLKSQLLPYFYSAAYQNTFNGQPLLKPVVYDRNLQLTKTPDLDHEFLVGEHILVAPIYQDTKMDAQGQDFRDGIYLPGKNDTWIDYFTGEEYRGHQVLNNFVVPLWKTPVFIKKGAIIPENNPNNNPTEIDTQTQMISIYPANRETTTLIYDDDGVSEAYLQGKDVQTLVKCKQDLHKIIVEVGMTEGDYQEFESQKQTIIKVKTDHSPQQVLVNGQKLAVTAYEFQVQHPLPFLSQIEGLKHVTNGSWLTIKIPMHDVTKQELKIEIDS
ncbi:hypothetical protein DS832_01060 [Bombilactobacillus bombi]|uniref:Uncharacterized protein n=1 Tax=Bombilactobacillus bombi TaxID=1303590 RepID=A0A3R6ZW76_9LACO|nr:TIM-barrel domain-containing protein [Bombilactobacillus bombi]RHW48486.1 hypothetical protein DS832_01060 [Bombilactobacillus bombi]